MCVKQNIVLSLIVVLITTSYDSGAISVNPFLCPTNKIAPHRRIASQNARTLGYFAELFNDNNQAQASGPGSLQEQPQADDPEDCGDIEDYDENDLSSVTPQRKQDYAENRFFFNHNFFPEKPPQYPPPNQPNPPQYRPPNQPNPPQYRPPNQPNPPQYRPPNQPNPPQYRPPNQPNPPQYRPTPPPFPQKPYPPTRPPYSSGGMFGNNFYRPPPYHEHYPSDNVKPVYEQGQDPPPVTYRPDGVVGGPLGQIVGVSQVRPTSPQYDEESPSTRRPYPNQRPSYTDYNQRPQRPRKLNENSSLIGSFIDLLFK